MPSSTTFLPNQAPMCWCKACGRFHAKARSKEHHAALKCVATFVGKKRRRG